MVHIKGFHHVQVCVPKGKEEEAKEFYLHTLGLVEIPKPESLRANGGFWMKAGNIEWHIGVEESENTKSKRHIALEVEDIHGVRAYLEKNQVPVQDEKEIPGIVRFSIFDPFGNRIELLEHQLQE